jgi:fructose/tagatose bisphosphate aldolase
VSEKRIIVYSLEQARAAAEAAMASGVPIILMSAPGMAGFMGPLWFKALVDEATISYPQANVTAMLDCADEAGTALAALRCGFQWVRFSGPEEARARLADIAGQLGASVEGVVAADTLDLLDYHDPLAACRAFLASSTPD